MIGIEERDTKTGIHVFRVHYTADPSKRAQDWQEEAARGMRGGLKGKAWRREMEIDWTVADGVGIYSDEFVRELHVSKDGLTWDSELPIVRGWDLGATHLLPACVWLQPDAAGRVKVLMELATWDGRSSMRTASMPNFADAVIAQSNIRFPGAEFVDVCDPSAWVRSMTDEKSCADILRAKSIWPTPGPTTFTERKELVRDVLSGLVLGAPKFSLDPNCAMIVQGLEGAYRYKKIGEQFLTTAEQNAWAHVLSALEYGLSGITQLREGAVEEEHWPEAPQGGMARASQYY